MKLVEELSANSYFYTGAIRKDMLQGNPSLTVVEKFKKKERGYHETVVLEDESQVIVRRNDNALVTMISNVLGITPIFTCSVNSRKEKK